MVNVLLDFKSLKKFPNHILDELNEHVELQTFERRDTVFHQGDMPNYLYGVVQGRIKMVHSTEYGKELLFAVHDPGQIVAEAPAIGGFLYPASAVTMTSSTLFKLERNTLISMIKRHPELGLHLLEFLGQRVIYFAEKLTQMAAMTVHQRIAKVLLDFIDQYGTTQGNRARLNIAITRQELADLVGTSIETAIRSMSLFKKQKILDYDQHQIIIEDKARLSKTLTSAIGGQCPLKSKKACP
ncbi:MAG: Crp/Fnr family transcriptional regulator [SAR324 cluster bacterium]|nr:Crp/Fnr family transcriptional regulator [SAR324 cluster bacterium]